MHIYLIKYSPVFIDSFKPDLANCTFVHVSGLGAELKYFYFNRKSSAFSYLCSDLVFLRRNSHLCPLFHRY